MEVVIPPIQNKKSGKGKTLLILIVGLVLAVGIGIGLIFVNQKQPTNVPNNAQEIQTMQQCPANGATCSWSAADKATSYHVIIKDDTTGDTIKDQTITGTQISFTPVVNDTFSCTVTPINTCGNGPTDRARNTCVAPNTPTPSPQPTEEITPTETPVPTETGTPTDTPVPTDTQTPTPTPTETPAPTETSSPLATPTDTPTPTEIVVAEVSPTEVPTAGPTSAEIPSAGSSSGVLFMIVSGVILVSLMLVF